MFAETSRVGEVLIYNRDEHCCAGRIDRADPGNLPDKVVTPRANELERSGLLQKICFLEYSFAPQEHLGKLHP